ncbi:immunity 63 family protein [Ruminococcaceae bacterium OttesenSCG-928-A16]|nr:immunity 63 family protein [Ruminococcaceae bacterium OttesenSCG-928-A16]
MLTEKELYQKVLVGLLKVPGFTRSMLDGRIGKPGQECVPYLYVQGENYVYECYERGQRIKHKTTQNQTIAMYWVYESLIFALAFKYELEHRNPLQDNRRLAFAKMSEWFLLIGTPFIEIWEQQLNHTLAIAPYSDDIHKILFLANEYEKMVKKLNHLPKAFSNKGKNAVAAICNRRFRSPSGGMQNPLWSVQQMSKRIRTIRQELGKHPVTPAIAAFNQDYERLVDVMIYVDTMQPDKESKKGGKKE